MNAAAKLKKIYLLIDGLERFQSQAKAVFEEQQAEDVAAPSVIELLNKLHEHVKHTETLIGLNGSRQ